MSAVPEHTISLDEYFALEETGEIKHEYYRGVMYAMTGASENHNLIFGETYRSLGNQLVGKPCRPYPSDFRLKIEAENLYTYPNLSVICGGTQFADKRNDTFLNPTLLIEILSPSTEAYDRGKKAGFYRTIPTLQEFLLIWQDQPRVERYRRIGADWLLSDFTQITDTVALPSIGCTLALEEIYRRISW